MNPERSARDYVSTLGLRWVGSALRYFATADSTNTRAKRLAELGWPVGTVVVADRQTAGRGRLGRRWHCPARSGILVSVIVLQPPFSTRHGGGVSPAWLTAAGALAMVEAARSTRPLGRPDLSRASSPSRASGSNESFKKPNEGSRPEAPSTAGGGGRRQGDGFELLIEWPNDIVAPDAAAPGGRRKLGGVLVELVEGCARPELAVLGVGLNVDARAEEFPPDIRPGAGSLATVFGALRLARDADTELVEGVGAGADGSTDPTAVGELAEVRRGIFGRFLAALEERLGRVGELAAELRERSFTVGREVELPARGESRQSRGRAVDFDDEMRLVVELPGGGNEVLPFRTEADRPACLVEGRPSAE